MSSNALRLIQTQYESDGDSSDAEIHISSASSSSSWSLSSIDNVCDEESIVDEKERLDKIAVDSKSGPKTKGELSVEDLPPIEKLSISIGVEELSQLGSIESIVDQLVIIRSFHSLPALDLDSVLFYRDGQPLGQVFDVFGPVVEPRYAVRFDSAQQIIDSKICAETPVYFAAQLPKPITGYVFTEQLRRLKGSDASWKHNNEPPEEVVEHSDDECERTHKQLKRNRSLI